MKVFITGGAGFIGKWLLRSLPDQADVVLLDSIDPQVHRSQTDFATELSQQAKCVKADVRDWQTYLEELEGSDVVVHLASQTGTGQSMYEMSRYIQQNVEGTTRLLEAISQLAQKPKRIVLTSSRAIYGEGALTDGTSVIYSPGRKLEDLQAGRWEVYTEDGQPLTPLPMKEDYLPKPTSIYGFTKLWQEDLIKNFAQTQDIDYAIFRLQNVYGPEQELRNPYTGIIGIFTSLITEKGKVEIFEDGQMTRDFVYVQDVANALVKGIFANQHLSGTFNVGSGKPTSLEELVNTIAKAAGKSADIHYSRRFRVGDIRHATADMDSFLKIFGSWQPTSLETGIQNYLQWSQSQNPLSEAELSKSFAEMEKQNLLQKSK